MTALSQLIPRPVELVFAVHNWRGGGDAGQLLTVFLDNVSITAAVAPRVDPVSEPFGLPFLGLALVVVGRLAQQQRRPYRTPLDRV